MKTSTLLITVLFAAATSLGLAATAQENWTSHCAKCHGADGTGKTTIGKKLKLADYTTAEAQANFTDEQASNVITNGVIENGKTKKNPFGEKLTAEEIADLVKFVRAFGPQTVAAAAPACEAGAACCKVAATEVAKKECCADKAKCAACAAE